MTPSSLLDDIACPHCGEAYIIPPDQRSEYTGRMLHCIKCGKQSTVAPAAEAVTPVPVASIDPVNGKLPLDYGGYPQSANKFSKPTKVVFLTAIGILCGGFLIAILLPSLNPTHVQSTRVKCASNLRNIALACIMYSNDQKDGSFPDSFDTMMKVEELTPEIFICPDSSDVRAAGTSPYLLSIDFAKPGHCSYVYLGKGLTSHSPPTYVLAYEPLINHKNTGMNVLYVDGHVDWLDLLTAQKLMAQLKAGAQLPATTMPTSGQK